MPKIAALIAVIPSLLSSYTMFTHGYSECYLVIWNVILSYRTEGSNTLLMEKNHYTYNTKKCIIHIPEVVASFSISNQSLNLSFFLANHADFWQQIRTCL